MYLGDFYHRADFAGVLEHGERLLEQLEDYDEIDELDRIGEMCGVCIFMAFALERMGEREEAHRLLMDTFTQFDNAGLTDEMGGPLFAQGRETLAWLTESVDAPATLTPEAHWLTASPTLSSQLDSRRLESFRMSCATSGADACLVAYHGQIVLEWYADWYQSPLMTMSSSKSWTSLLAGILVDDGVLSLDDPTARWIPEWEAGAERGVTVGQLLVMSSGIASFFDEDEDVQSAAEKNAFVFGLDLEAEPGSRFLYSNEGSQLLSPILARAAGEPLDAFARARLFEPLGMRSTWLGKDRVGDVLTYADARTSMRDFARIGQLILDRGVAPSGERVVSQEWLTTMTEPSEHNDRYGALWWLPRYGRRGSITPAAMGALRTDCVIDPRQQLLVARIQNLRQTGESPFDRSKVYKELLGNVVITS